MKKLAWYDRTYEEKIERLKKRGLPLVLGSI